MRYRIQFITQVHQKNFFVASLSSRSGQVFQGATCRDYRNAPLNHPPFFYFAKSEKEKQFPAPPNWTGHHYSFGAVRVGLRQIHNVKQQPCGFNAQHQKRRGVRQFDASRSHAYIGQVQFGFLGRRQRSSRDSLQSGWASGHARATDTYGANASERIEANAADWA